MSSAGYVEGWEGGFCGPACCEGGGDGCGVTAQPSLPATDKAARHGRRLIPFAAELLKGDEMLRGFTVRPGAGEKGTEGERKSTVERWKCKMTLLCTLY